MGKRKHKEEDEDQTEVAKRFKKENGEDSDHIINGFNNINVESVADPSRYEVYLIKKPIKMNIEELGKLKWSMDDDVLSKNKIKTSSGSYRAIVSKSNKKERMVHVPAITEIRANDARNIKAAGVVHGSVVILPAEVKKKYLGGSIYEEGEETPDDAMIHPNLNKIKREANLELELESKKQRNRAFGLITDSEGSYPILPDLLLNNGTK